MKTVLEKLNVISAQRGALIAIEEHRNIPFEIKRVYFIFKTKPRVRRGLHAHRKLRQALIAVSGACKVLLDDGTHAASHSMDSANSLLLVEPLVWHEMYDFSEDCVLLALANDYFDEQDYIHSYQEFLIAVQQGNVCHE